MPFATIRVGLVLAGAALAAAPIAAPAMAQPTPDQRPSTSHAASRPDAKRVATVIRIHNFAFHTLRTVAPGAKVKVVNRDGTTHTVTSNKGLFSVRIPAGQSRTFSAPRKAGTYRFHCRIHTDMHGHFRVR